MSATQFFPIPPELFASACSTVSGKVSRLPFLRSGVTVTGEAIGVAMECLNALPQKTLAISTRKDATGTEEGLDQCLEERLKIPGKAAAPVIAEVLCSAGIAEQTLIMDRHVHGQRRGIRLVSPWTWHIASTLAPSVRLGGDEAGLSWLDVCPVCRTGILSRLVGKQLFGIPRTDFIIECSSCGAKFIPVGPAFRLVSIATIRDPLWKKHLDKTYPPEQWAALARGPGPAGSAARRPPAAVIKAERPVLPAASVTLSALRDGSLAVPVAGKLLYFRPVPLTFSGPVREDAFLRVQKTLEEVLARPAFVHLLPQIQARYSRYLSMKTGLFLSQLKERHDPFYREFLNPFGDERYGTFRAAGTAETEKAGVLVVVVNRGLYHVISSAEPLGTTINNRLARVGAEDCLLDGDADRCRINALLCTARKEAGLYAYPAGDDGERLAVTGAIEALLAGGRT